MPSQTLRVHIENTRRKTGIARITPQHWAAACARHGVPARREQLAARAPHLTWLHAMSAGIDGLLPLDWLPRGVAFTNNSGAHGHKAFQYMLMAYNLLNSRMPAIIANQQRRRWEQLFSPDIAGKTAVIVGMGDLGEGAARAAKALGLHVIGVRRSARRNPHADRIVTFRQLDRVLPQADFVVIAVPLTPQTRHLLDARRLDLLKPAAGIINIARGPVIDTAALVRRLRAGRIAGAVLDVVDPEPLPATSPLWRVPNLVLTPHISCDDGERYIDLSLDLWFANLARFVAGKPLQHRIDPKLGY